MKKSTLREMIMSGLFIALGLVFPMVFHLFGQGLGKSFLPMHIPVLLAGFILSLPFAVAVGALTPLLSALLTGMPPMFPVLPYMAFELMVYAASANMMSRKLKLNTYLSLIISMVAGRIAAGIIVWGMVGIFGVKLPGPLAFIVSTVTVGIPGIIIQLVFIPPIIILLKKTSIIRSEVFQVE